MPGFFLAFTGQNLLTMQLQTNCTGDGAGGKDEKGQRETRVPVDAHVAKCRVLNLFFPRPSDLDRSRSVFHRPVKSKKRYTQLHSRFHVFRLTGVVCLCTIRKLIPDRKRTAVIYLITEVLPKIQASRPEFLPDWQKKCYVAPKRAPEG